MGESLEERQTAQRERVTVLEANLDDMSPQVFGYVIDRLLEAGALDVFATPVQMKKSRPGLVLTVLARNQDVERLLEADFRRNHHAWHAPAAGAAAYAGSATRHRNHAVGRGPGQDRQP